MILLGSIFDFRNRILSINVKTTSTVITQDAFAGFEDDWNAL